MKGVRMSKITTSLPVFVLDFEPPLVGFEDRFNTFRLGRTWAVKLKRLDHVLLMDVKAKQVFGRGEVLRIELGPLKEMALMHAIENHNQLSKTPFEAAEDLMVRMRKRFGPHIATDTKVCTVIYLKRKG
jgi:hypothetical protein